MSIEEIELFQKKEDADVYLVHWIIGENLTCILPFFDKLLHFFRIWMKKFETGQISREIKAKTLIMIDDTEKDGSVRR